MLYKHALSITHPELAAQWHPTKNDALTPDQITAGSGKEVWWLCPHPAGDHEWQAPILRRSSGKGGCSCCLGKTVVPSNCLATTHPELAQQWHPTKNGKLTPKQVTAGSNQRVWWICPHPAGDHEWQATMCDRARDRGCSCCRGLTVVLSNSLAVTDPDLAARWHPTKNGQLTPRQVTAGSHKRVWWTCPHPASDHEWEAPIDRFVTTGGACSCCRGFTVVPSNSLAVTHPDLANEWHPTKNGSLTPGQVMAGSHKKVWWQCHYLNCAHEWEASIRKRAIREQGCRACNESRGEKAVAAFLDGVGIKYKREAKFATCRNERALRFDFLMDHNSRRYAIEFHGMQHFEPCSFGGSRTKEENFRLIQHRDAIKRTWCADPANGVTLLELACKPEEVGVELSKWLAQI
jgi:hypothetical protein